MMEWAVGVARINRGWPGLPYMESLVLDTPSRYGLLGTTQQYPYIDSLHR